MRAPHNLAFESFPSVSDLLRLGLSSHKVPTPANKWIILKWWTWNTFYFCLLIGRIRLQRSTNEYFRRIEMESDHRTGPEPQNFRILDWKRTPKFHFVSDRDSRFWRGSKFKKPGSTGVARSGTVRRSKVTSWPTFLSPRPSGIGSPRKNCPWNWSVKPCAFY